MGDQATATMAKSGKVPVSPTAVCALKEKKKGSTASLRSIEYDSHGVSPYRTLFRLGCSSNDALDQQGNVSLLQRVDSLDHTLFTLEGNVPIEPATSPKVITNSRRHSSARFTPLDYEKHCKPESAMSPKVITTSRRHLSARFTPLDWEKHCKPAVFVLEEVEAKGSLVERVSELEKRVMQLQQTLSAKLSGNVQHAAAVSSAPSATPPHEQDVDVEKHIEVVPSLRSHSERSSFLVNNDADNQSKGHSQYAVDDMQGLSSTIEGPASDENLVQRQLGQKSVRFKKWLAKQLHIRPAG